MSKVLHYISLSLLLVGVSTLEVKKPHALIQPIEGVHSPQLPSLSLDKFGSKSLGSHAEIPKDGTLTGGSPHFLGKRLQSSTATRRATGSLVFITFLVIWVLVIAVLLAVWGGDIAADCDGSGVTPPTSRRGTPRQAFMMKEPWAGVSSQEPWARKYQACKNEDKEALALLLRCKIISQQEFAGSDLSEEHFAECLWIAKTMLQEKTLDDWVELQKNGRAAFEECVTAVFATRSQAQSKDSGKPPRSVDPFDTDPMKERFPSQGPTQSFAMPFDTNPMKERLPSQGPTQSFAMPFDTNPMKERLPSQGPTQSFAMPFDTNPIKERLPTHGPTQSFTSPWDTAPMKERLPTHGPTQSFTSPWDTAPIKERMPRSDISMASSTGSAVTFHNSPESIGKQGPAEPPAYQLPRKPPAESPVGMVNCRHDDIATSQDSVPTHAGDEDQLTELFPNLFTSQQSPMLDSRRSYSSTSSAWGSSAFSPMLDSRNASQMLDSRNASPQEHQMAPNSSPQQRLAAPPPRLAARGLPVPAQEHFQAYSSFSGQR